jgi:ribokinase
LKPVIVVVGSLNMDLVVRTARLPVSGETVLGHGFEMVPGGKGANQAVAAARLGAGSVAVRMIGRVGVDSFGDRLKAGLASAGVDVSAVHGSRSQPTGVALITVDSAGANQIIVSPGANGQLAESEVERMRAAFQGASLALFQLETPLATVAAALRVARQEGARTILDPAPAQMLEREILGEVDILTPNESEACCLLGVGQGRIGIAEASDVAERLAGSGPKSVVLKMGDRGCFFRGAGESYHVPGFAVIAVDSTAAGDTFNGALAVALAEGSSIPHALRFANAAGALSVTKRGAQTSIPSRADVDALPVRDWPGPS